MVEPWYNASVARWSPGRDAKAPPLVKVCCIASVDEAGMAVRHGAAALGLVSAMPSGPGVIPDALIAEIAATVPSGVASFLLTSRQSAAGIIEQHRRMRTSVIQMCDHVNEAACEEIRAALPGVTLVQAVHVTGEAAIAEAIAAAAHVDAILLDSGDRGAAVKRLGGTGRPHDWRVSRRIRDAVAVPVFLAGGLRPDNVAEAIAAVAPDGVDVCTGVRTAGHLDEVKLAAFFAAVRSTAAGAAASSTSGRGGSEVSP
jgi:phosphoribosylanthranilate isomerase